MIRIPVKSLKKSVFYFFELLSFAFFELLLFANLVIEKCIKDTSKTITASSLRFGHLIEGDE